MDDKDFIFPTRHGAPQGGATERTLLHAVGGGNTIRTQFRDNADGTQTMLRTRGGFPEFTTTPKPLDLKPIPVEYEMCFNGYPTYGGAPYGIMSDGAGGYVPCGSGDTRLMLTSSTPSKTGWTPDLAESLTVDQVRPYVGNVDWYDTTLQQRGKTVTWRGANEMGRYGGTIFAMDGVPNPTDGGGTDVEMPTGFAPIGYEAYLGTTPYGPYQTGLCEMTDTPWPEFTVYGRLTGSSTPNVICVDGEVVGTIDLQYRILSAGLTSSGVPRALVSVGNAFLMYEIWMAGSVDPPFGAFGQWNFYYYGLTSEIYLIEKDGGSWAGASAGWSLVSTIAVPQGAYGAALRQAPIFNYNCSKAIGILTKIIRPPSEAEMLNQAGEDFVFEIDVEAGTLAVTEQANMGTGDYSNSYAEYQGGADAFRSILAVDYVGSSVKNLVFARQVVGGVTSDTTKMNGTPIAGTGFFPTGGDLRCGVVVGVAGTATGPSLRVIYANAPDAVASPVSGPDVGAPSSVFVMRQANFMTHVTAFCDPSPVVAGATTHVVFTYLGRFENGSSTPYYEYDVTGEGLRNCKTFYSNSTMAGGRVRLDHFSPSNYASDLNFLVSPIFYRRVV